MCTVETTALLARYELPSLHSTPAHFPFSTIRLFTHLLVRITPLCASMNRASATVSAPEPPLGSGRPECCCLAVPYANRPVTGESGGSAARCDIYNAKIRE